MNRLRLRPFQTFSEVADAALQMLAASSSMALWMLTRTQGRDWIPLVVRDSHYGLRPGQIMRWEDSLCSRMATSGELAFVDDVSAEPAYRDLALARALRIGSYIGSPLYRADGGLFGTLCAFDPMPRRFERATLAPILVTISRALATWFLLQSEIEQRDRELLRLELAACTDPLTGLPDHSGWQRILDYEQMRLDHVPTGTGILVVRLRVNDTAGEDLRRFAGLLQRQFGITDTLAHLGDGHFAAVLPHTCPEPLAVVADRIRSAIRQMRLEADIGHAWSGLQGDLTRAWRDAERDRDTPRD